MMPFDFDRFLSSVRRGILDVASSQYSKILAIGLAIRVLVAPFAIQGDIVLYNWVAHFIVQGHFNPYTYYYGLYGTELFPPGLSSQHGAFPAVGIPPLFYLLDSLYLWILKGLGIFPFLSNWNYGNLWLFADQARAFFLMKAFMFPFDILFLWAFLKCVGHKWKKAGYWAWALNPFIIYVTYVWGQTDVIPAALTMLAVWLAKSSLANGRFRNALLACISVGLAASFKLFAIALLPIFVIILARSMKKSWFQLSLAGVSSFVIMLPFISRPFLRSLFSYSGYILSMSLAPHDFPQYATLYLAFAAYVFIIYHLYAMENPPTFDRLIGYCLGVFSILLGLSQWLPNWFLWALPFLLVLVFLRPKFIPIYGLVTLFYFTFLQAWGNALWLGMFCPLTYGGSCLNGLHGSLGIFPGFSVILLPNHLTAMVGLGYTGLATSLFFLTYISFKRYDEHTSHPNKMIWAGFLAVPLALAICNLILGSSYIQERGLPILQTVEIEIAQDPAFFAFYFIVLGGICFWPILAELIRRSRQSGSLIKTKLVES